MRTHLRHRASRAGFTLIEIVISAGILAMVAGSLVAASLQGDRAYRATNLETSLDALARRTLDRVAEELATVGAGVLVPNPTGQFGSDTLSFQTPIGFAGGVIVWGTQSRIAFEYETGEINDGVDNNGDGLADEGQLVLTRNLGTTNDRIVLCHHVREYAEGETAAVGDDNGNGVSDERGFNVQRVGNLLVLRLSLEDVAPGQAAYARTLTTSVTLRN